MNNVEKWFVYLKFIGRLITLKQIYDVDNERNDFSQDYQVNVKDVIGFLPPKAIILKA